MAAGLQAFIPASKLPNHLLYRKSRSNTRSEIRTEEMIPTEHGAAAFQFQGEWVPQGYDGWVYCGAA